jgi:hypothetical protein
MSSMRKYVHLETDQFGRLLVGLVCFAPRPPVLDEDVLALDVTKLAEPLQKRLGRLRWAGGVTQVANPIDFPCLLRLGGERRKSQAESENDREPDQPHGHLGEDGLAGSLTERRDANQHGTHVTRAP